jgi:hypothetical protein
VYRYRCHRRECINLLSEVDESEEAKEGKGCDTTKSTGDFAEIVKRMANTQPVSNNQLVQRQEKPKG